MFSKFPFRSIWRPLLVCLFILSFYQALVSGGVLLPTNGINLVQSNIIKAQRYVYENSTDLKMVMVGSSLAANIRADEVGDKVRSIAMAGGTSQTGLEIVKRKAKKPPLILVEINDTLVRKVDRDLVDSLYHPLFYAMRLYLPILREEYRPISILIDSFKKPSNSDPQLSRQERDKRETRYTNPQLSERGIAMAVDAESQPLSEKEAEILRQEAEFLKGQIADIQKEGGRLILFDIPREPRVDRTLKKQQVTELMRQLFPPDRYEWLPSPPAREWRTNDGIHLIATDAEDYALFLRKQLLEKAA